MDTFNYLYIFLTGFALALPMLPRNNLFYWANIFSNFLLIPSKVRTVAYECLGLHCLPCSQTSFAESQFERFGQHKLAHSINCNEDLQEERIMLLRTRAVPS